MKIPKTCVLVLATPFTSAYAQSLTSAVLSNSDTTTYEESSPGVLTLNNSLAPLDALVGTATAAGGNIELFASSDLARFDDASAGGVFANASPSVLTAGFSNGASVTVSGLDGQDWFLDGSSIYDTSFGADNLANQWFGDFVTALGDQSGGQSNIFVLGQEEALFDTFRDNGGFAQISDPNVSFINIDTPDSMVNVGLGGFLDATPVVADLLGAPQVLLASIFQNGIQISEVAQINGENVYSFEGVDSGVVLNDGIDSYSATFVLSAPIPEPSSSVLLFLAGVAGLSRRKR